MAEDGSRGERGRLHARHQHHPRYDWRPFQKWIDDEGQISNSGSETDPYIDLWDLMDASGVDVLLAGHNHIYQRWAPQDGDGVRDPNGVAQFTVGTGGRSLTRSGRSPGPRTSSRPRTKRSECCR